MSMQDPTRRRDRLETYCRRLGHPISFAYCRSTGDGRPCQAIYDCWYGRVDVETALGESRSPDQVEGLGRVPADKLSSLLELIEAARSRKVGSDTTSCSGGD